MVGLGELNGLGHWGVAILAEQGQQTAVTIYLAEGLSGDADAEAAGATASDDTEAAADTVTADIKGFAYSPDPVEVPVNGTVTWTTSDAAPHAATGRDRGRLQSGTLDQGERYRWTFDEAGTFDYFCEFHPNVKGTVVVR